MIFHSFLSFYYHYMGSLHKSLSMNINLILIFNYLIYSIYKRQRNKRSNWEHPLDHWKSKRVPEKHIFLFYWLCQSLWLCGSQQTLENLKEMGIPDHLTCLLRNLYAGQEATVRNRYETDWFQIRKGVHQGCILSPCLFNLYAEYIMRNTGLDEA